jgi:hypothetical protein
MQVARLLEDGSTGRWPGKLRQIRVALALERRLERATSWRFTCSCAPFGGNIEGVRAASLAYFGKEPAQLTPAEAALLVALPQAPEARRPDRVPAAARAARARVLDRLAAAGVIGAEAQATARDAPVPDAQAAFPALAAASDRSDARRRSRPCRAPSADRCRSSGQPRSPCHPRRARNRRAGVGRHSGRRPSQRAVLAQVGSAGLRRRPARRLCRHDAGRPLPRIDAEAADLWPRLRSRPGPSRNPDRRSPGRSSTAMRRPISTGFTGARFRSARRCNCR